MSDKPSYEQLLAACKFALAALSLQAIHAKAIGQDFPHKDFCHVAGHRLYEVVSMAEPDWTGDGLIAWAKTELVRIAVEFDDGHPE